MQRSAHGELTPSGSAADALGLILEQDADRLDWLVPVRHGRMSASPFAFYRGAARMMAADLAGSVHSGLTVQLGGDAHLMNFGAFASPERRLVFDANDFDETLPGPFEWDVKRLAASVMIASLHIGADVASAEAITRSTVAAYRTAMARFATLGALPLYYEHLDVDAVRQAGLIGEGRRQAKLLDRFEAKARSRDNLQALRKLAVEVDGRFRLRADPPVLLPFTDLDDAGVLHEAATIAFERYQHTLDDARRNLLARYTPVDIGLKVVGVGSVGTRCLIMLLQGRDRDDPLFLQLKEAGSSVLEEFLGPSAYPNHGQRVVEGQRVIQAVSDIFLGWTRDTVLGRRHFYVRQLRDWKNAFDVDSADRENLERYAWLCGWTLANGHARSGDPVAIDAYLGRSDTFDRAVGRFARRYAERNQECFDELRAAVADGRIEAQAGV